MTRAVARSHPNIALVKYWGKQNEQLILPAAGSLSLTIDAFPTTTEVTLDDRATADTFSLNGVPAAVGQTARVSALLDIVRAVAGVDTFANVDSISEIPTDAGLASSAAGFSALAAAAAAAYGLELDSRALSRLARRGSGSASRSVIPGLAVWHAGNDEESFAEPVNGPDVRMVIVTLSTGAKPVSSREAMRTCMLTSPFYPAWVASTKWTLDGALEACRDNDFTRLGRITELHANRMHALIQSADPPIRYLTPQSVAVFDAVAQLRAAGRSCYATADAGPNVVVLTTPEDAEPVARHLAELGETRIVGAGPGAAVIERGIEP
ncbi:MAG TPA: diphosphomevalonate decarboxylase [Candidatus Agrococcus pullicola]|uniref:diphosphomevalonate decarboxylase n=1 Tax=Candidatus Agrococcus pullicola TaxID=2838429 RepID=A0A9D1YWL5_9MICO|nr:diphosphomevalonate decarboxylase [Candidatus Agrococcus pullicola]